jgi:hypothetical protein
MTNGSWHHALVTMCLVTALLFGGVSEAAHVHSGQPRCPGGHAIASHDCGEHERHIPLNQIEGCSLCQHSGRVAPCLAVHIVYQAPGTFVLPIISTGEDLARPHFSPSGKRGPPSA